MIKSNSRDNGGQLCSLMLLGSNAKFVKTITLKLLSSYVIIFRPPPTPEPGTITSEVIPQWRHREYYEILEDTFW